MKLLFINEFLSRNYEMLYSKLELVMIMWIIVLVAIIIDLISGLHKATKNGIEHTSYGFRQTVIKSVQYYRLMSFALLFDMLASLVVTVPYVTMLGSIFLVFIEAKSVFEKVKKRDRQRVNESVKDIIVLLEHRDDLAKGLLNILKRTVDNEKEVKDALSK